MIPVHFGRTTRQYDPFIVADTTLASLGVFETHMDSSATVTSYDVLDRVTKVQQPLGVTTLTYYDIQNDAGGSRRFFTKVTDPNGGITRQYSDYDGRQVQVTDAAGGITRMRYDNLGQLLSSTDPEGFKTSYGYDNLGRVVRREHPDAGTTRYTYDAAGNLLQENNPLGQINYDYAYYRPRHKRYSYMTGNDVTYTYGTTGTEIGRLVRVVDGSGMFVCKYDALGNIIDETRTIALPGNDEVYRFSTEYNYDSWGRVLTMTYSDGETVTYTYQWGGDLYAMDGVKNGVRQSYIDGIRYNGFGQRVSIRYGNRTYTRYSYDALHRLSHLTSFRSSGAIMQDIDYTYDHCSNIMNIHDQASPAGTLGGGYRNWYEYVALHRLVRSYGDNVPGHYDYTMEYTSSGRIMKKYRSTPPVTVSTPVVNMYYGYCEASMPHAVRRIFDEQNGMRFDFRWDASGNLGQISTGNPACQFETGRFLFWTEDSRMHAVADDKYYSYYAYDHGGERRLKLTGNNNVININADFIHTVSLLKTPTIYPSAYMVLSNRGYTKHYYAGSERVATRIGGGGLYASGVDPKLSDRSGKVFCQSPDQVNSRRLKENKSDCIANGLCTHGELLCDIMDIPSRLQADTAIDYTDFRRMIHDMRAIHHDEPDVYFYHSDHPGSASWITDNGGVAVQHLQYLPYGERYVDQHVTGYQERFTFTGKERDEETGYGYFGARYMDHELTTMWLSVDPMSDKYPGISPYAYCAWNPVKLVDPDGKEIDDYRLNTRTGALILERKTKDNFDLVTINDGEETFTIPKGVLNGNKEGQDISKTGFCTEGGNQNQAVALMVKISYKCDIELAAWGFDDNNGRPCLDVLHWNGNNSRRGHLYNNQGNEYDKRGTRRFALHIHPDIINGGGRGYAGKADFKSAAKVHSNYYIISPKHGVTQYFPNTDTGKAGCGKTITPAINTLPKSLKPYHHDYQ